MTTAENKPNGHLGSKPLREYEGGSKPMAYYARGHVDRAEFLAEVREWWGGLSGDATAEHVRHERYRCVPTGQKGEHLIVPTQQGTRGASPVTIVDN